jgi:DNA segregation ATPase FtsK/SpoIIIE-like protein
LFHKSNLGRNQKLAAGAGQKMDDAERNSYQIKDIRFGGSMRRILLQSENGPCPLLAFCNVLLLQNQMQISQDVRHIAFSELVQIVSNMLFDINAKHCTDDDRGANIRQSLEECIEILPKLNVGLDINCRFSGPRDFEFTKELAVFDLLDISLFHGWVISEQDRHAYPVVSPLTYNHLVERLITYEDIQARVLDGTLSLDEDAPAESAPKPAADSENAQTGKDGADTSPAADPLAHLRCPSPSTGVARLPSAQEVRKILEEGTILKQFHDRTQTQLSYEGLLALHEVITERQLAVYFRNNHFSTVMKHQGELFLLCTDIGFANSEVVWEKFDEVDGDTFYCNAEFQESTGEDAAANPEVEPTPALGPDGEPELTQEEMDQQLAAMMQHEEIQQQQQEEQLQQQLMQQQMMQEMMQQQQQQQQQQQIQQQQRQQQQRQQQERPPQRQSAPQTAAVQEKKKGKKSCIVQ